jgi:hypothetical protein
MRRFCSDNRDQLTHTLSLYEINKGFDLMHESK